MAAKVFVVLLVVDKGVFEFVAAKVVVVLLFFDKVVSELVVAWVVVVEVMMVVDDVNSCVEQSIS